MQEVLPLERVKNNFKTTIVKLTLKLKKDMVAYYQAETTYGNMTLIVEEFQIPHSDNSKESNIVQCFIQARNTLIRNDGLIVPLIYEQEVIKVQENILVCLTLTEPIEIIRRSQLSEFKETALFQNLVMSVYKASRSPFVYSSDCYSLQWVLRSVHTHLFSFDFTRLQERAYKQLQNNKSNTFQLFKRQLCRLMIDTRSGRMRQIILIKQRSVTFNIQNISQAKNEFDLALMFNLLQHEKVLVISQTKEKQFLVSKLNGKITIEYQHQRYQDLTFEGGFRMDAFTQLSLQTLKKQFFQDKMIYKIHKDRYQIVTKTHITSDYCWIKRDIEFSDLVLIDQQVSKSEFISFLIGYFKNVQPTLNLINFHKEQNAIRIQYVNKHNKIKTVLMKFNHKYVIKDEEVSMIIQKAKLKNTVLSLVGMMITDSFLMFLANCDKMLNITQLDISFCQQLSEIAIHSLFASPLCKNLKIIKIQKLPIINFAAVKFKNNLKDLHINQCSHQEEMLSFSGWNIQKLEAIGVNISMDLPRTLKYLSLSAEVELQSLRLLRNLQLTHLKIRIVQNKKNISNFLGAFSIKQSPVKVFAEGPSSKTLKLLDVSGSKIKLRQLRPIFMIQSLQTLIAEDIEREKFIELVLPQHIMNISFKNSQIIPQILTETLSRTIIIIKLNLCGTAIDQHSLAAFIKTKKYINLLDIDEQQLNFYLLQRKSGIQTLNLHVNKIIRDQHEHFLNKILLIQTQSSKQLNLLCNQKNEQKLVNKVNRFFKFYQVKLQKLTANMNLFINNIPLWKQIVYIREEEPHQNLSIYNPHAQQHKVKLHPIAFINSTLQQKILTLQLFNISLHKYLTQFPQSLVDISIRSNRILGIEAVDMIHKYAGSQLRSFDFRDCIFGYSQVKNTLYAFENLQLVNEGEYQIQMDDKDNCEQQLQRTLKFFMKLRDHEKMKLKIKASQIKQTQLFYSIVYEIIHQNQKNITYLNLQFANMRADNSQYLWKKVLSLKKIDTLKISYFNHKVTERQYSQLNGLIEQLNFCNLFALQIATNLTFLIPISLSSKNIRKINLQFWELSINENILIKILKNLHSLNHVEIRAADSQLANLNKLQDSLQKMHHLTHLNLNLQNCVLKQLQIYELISNLTKNKHLQRLQLNINNTNIQLPELVRVCELLQKNNKFCHIVVYAIQPRKQVLNRDESELIPRGIEIFYNY